MFQRISDDHSIFTIISIHEDEPKPPKVIDTMTKERALEEYKRTVDPPQKMKTTLGMRDNSR